MVHSVGAGAAECMDVDLSDRRQSHAQASTNNRTSSVQFMPRVTINSSTLKSAASAQAAPQTGASTNGLSDKSSNTQIPPTDPACAQNGVLADTQHKPDASEALASLPKHQQQSAQHAPAQHDTAQHDPAQHDAVHHDSGPLPMLASACPGWVCYAEKTHGSYILPYISTAKSPQVISPNSTTLPNPTMLPPLPPSWHPSSAAGLHRFTMWRALQS